MWSRVLVVDAIDIDSDFFALGGHSLLITRVLASLRDELHVSLKVKNVFNAPSIRELARVVTEQQESSQRIDDAQGVYL
ncbi:phosphopantetheine-binding protein [Dickeya zeae]|uniref:phosphopantetheine-binding protein n=1 Tax=Dickeya zeae TaxID=204042 RepID=UPI0022A95EEC